MRSTFLYLYDYEIKPMEVKFLAQGDCVSGQIAGFYAPFEISKSESTKAIFRQTPVWNEDDYVIDTESVLINFVAPVSDQSEFILNQPSTINFNQPLNIKFKQTPENIKIYGFEHSSVQTIEITPKIAGISGNKFGPEKIETAPAPPQIFVSNYKSTSVDLEWNDAGARFYEIFLYDAQKRLVTTRQFFMPFGKLDSLSSNELYTVNIVAHFNNNRRTNPGVVTFQTTSSVEGIIASKIKSTSLSLDWSPILYATKYQLAYTINGNKLIREVQATNCELTNLVPDTVYDIKLTAIIQAGASSDSMSKVVKTMRKNPEVLHSGSKFSKRAD